MTISMRILGLVFVSCCAVAVVGCGGGGSKKADMAMDLAAADNAVASETCAQVVECASGCTGANMATCEQTCRSMGSATAQQQFDALFGCAYGVCLGGADGGAGDGGAGACSSTSDTSAGCQQCVMNAAEGATCSAELTACGF